MNKDELCPVCECEYAKYEYYEKLYCGECLLEELIVDDKIQSWNVQHYMIDGEYVGNDNDDNVDEVEEEIVNRLKIKRVKV